MRNGPRGEAKTICVTFMLALAACGDSEAKPTVSVSTEAGVVRPQMDAAVIGLDAMARAEPDAAEASVALDALAGAECAGDIHELHAARSEGRAFASALAGNRFYVAYVIPTCGGSLGSNNAQGLALVSMATSGPPDAPVPLVNSGASDCDLTRTPALAAVKGGSVDLFYLSNHGTGGGLSLFAKNALDDSAGVPLTVADDASWQDLSARVDNSQLVQLVWARGGAISTMRLNHDPRALTAASAEAPIARLSVGNIGSASANTLAAVAWVSASESAPGIYLSFFDDATGLSEPVVLAAQARAASSVSIASQASSAIVAYSDETGAVFMRTLASDKTVGPPVRLTSNNQEISDVALARFGAGYAVAYRSLALAGGQTVVRLLAIDERGAQAGTRFIAEARRDGSGLDIHAANDGRLILTWADPSSVIDPNTQTLELETTVKVARLTCL